MHLIDIIIVLLCSLALLRGAETGFVRQAASLTGLVIGLVVGSLLANVLQTSILTSLSIVLIAVLIAVNLTARLGNKLVHVVQKIRLEKIDRIIGASIGGVVGLLLIWLCSSLTGIIPSESIKVAVRDSKVIRWLDGSLPPASQIMAWADNSLAHTKLPEILSQFEPKLPNSNVAIPSLSRFNSVVENHQNSVVEIEGRSCNGVGVGTGFFAADNVVITNAHVIAGMVDPYVSNESGRHEAEVIGFYPELDIAVLQTANVAQNKPLILAPQEVAAGTAAVTIGFPEGGPKAATPAVVLERFIARGADIYGERITQRNVYTLKSDIHPGNSGGPLLDEAGKVIGVIFAKSTTYDQVGYALTMPDVIEAFTSAVQNPNSGTSTRCASF